MTRAEQRAISAVGAIVQAGLAYYFWNKKPHLAGFFIGGAMTAANMYITGVGFPVSSSSTPTALIPTALPTGPNVGLTQEQIGRAIVAGTSDALASITGGSGEPSVL